MIRTLTIHNIALIEEISLHLNNGMIVLSGETGAGKSIIIDAVSLILGGRAEKSLIRTGCEKGTVEAEFEAKEVPELSSLLERENIESAGDSIILYREISQSGRNICRINGVVVTLSVLRETAAFLLNLHGQNEYQFLSDQNKQLTYLDMMGEERHRVLLENVQNSFRRFIGNHRYYAKLIKMNETKDRRADILRTELEEIYLADLHPGDEEKLSEESRKLHKASRLDERIRLVKHLLASGDNEGDALHDLQSALKELRNLSTEDRGFETFADQAETLFYGLDELVHGFDAFVQQYDFSEAALDETESRLESIRKVIRKYGPGEEDVIRNTAEMEKEYNTLKNLQNELEKTGAEHKKLLLQYRNDARELTESRRGIALDFEQKMMKELKNLGMDKTVIKVVFEEHTGGKPIMPSLTGDDRVCFMISPNPGEPLKPISEIASGGELSRLMLAMKSIEAGRSGLQTMIFDEIDTGVSGRMAQAVAEKMIQISRRQQVICISHLPQIAAAADFHYLIFKGVRGERTYTEAAEMTTEERINEIARMISGANGISEEARQYAKQLITASDKSKSAKRSE